MNHIIIRTCVKDDYLARLCYESFKKANIQGNFTFVADNGEYTHINVDDIPIIYKDQTNNYGGYAGVVGLLHYGLGKLSFGNTDNVIISDSDIIVFENFVNEIDVDHCGVGGRSNGFLHISGQMQLFKGNVVNRLKNLTIDEIQYIVHKEMVPKRIHVADDSFNSYMTDKWKCNKKLLDLKYWLHHKAYECNEMDFDEAISIMKNKKDLL